MSIRDGIASEHHLSPDELQAGLDHLRAAPRAEGVVELIVRRPAVDEREVVETAELDVDDGLLLAA